LFKFFENPN